MPTVDVDALLDQLTNRETITPSTLGITRFDRAAEHVVLAPGTGAATPHATFAAGTAAHVSDWIDRAAVERGARIVARLPLLEMTTPPAGFPMLPTFELPRTGAQSGQKREVPSHAINVASDPGVEIDVATHLNVSMQLEHVAPLVVERLMRLAVVVGVEEAIVKALEAKAADGGANLGAGLARFTGLFAPTILLLPPASFATQLPNLAGLIAAGITPVLSPMSTKALLVSPDAVAGWIVRVGLSAVEPSVLGRSHAEAAFGRIGVNPAGVVSFATP